MRARPDPRVIDTHDVTYPRFANRGRTFVYVLPCLEADVLKVGFSRDPIGRLRQLHRRFFDFFDLDRGLLIETDQLRDARRIERLFITSFVDDRASAPLVVRRAAAGHTEWYRGIYPAVTTLARRLSAAESLPLHEPLRPWLRAHFEAWSDPLFDGSARMLEAIEYERCNVPAEYRSGHAAQALAHVLDTYTAVGVDVAARVPREVAEWYRQRDAFKPIAAHRP